MGAVHMVCMQRAFSSGWRDPAQPLMSDYMGRMVAANGPRAQPRRRRGLAARIALRRRDELGDLAGRINTMAHDIEGMLDAKRALLLALSHELRSPLTRARLNAELLPTSFFFQAEDGIRDLIVTGVQTCALPI